MAEANEKATQAFRRLLAEGQSGGQAKVDALVALAQRTVLIPKRPPGQEAMQALVDEQGSATLPIFSDEEDLVAAGRLYGWADRDGRVRFEEIGAREAMRRVVLDRMKALVIDIASEHALDASPDELAPLVIRTTRSDSEGPFAAVGRISTTMLEAARRSQTPPPSAFLEALGAPTPGPRPRPELTPAPSPRPRALTPAPSEREETTTARHRALSAASHEASAPGTHFSPLLEEPTDEALDDLAAVLREYPEVEWGTLCRASHSGEAPSTCVAVRVEPAYRQRVGEIETKLALAGAAHALVFTVALVDDANHVQEARQVGLAFFPWKRKKLAH